VRQAPPVSLRCDGSAAWRGLHALLAATAAASLAAWVLLHGGAEASTAGAASAAAALLAAAAGWLRARPEPAELRWDGQAWWLDGAAGRVDVMMDLGPWMLLRFRPTAGASRWLPVPDAGPARHGLRAALYSRAAVRAPAAPVTPGPSD
jgi:hypothetical protein